MYVVGKDIKNNVLYVSLGDDSEYLISTSCLLTNVNLINKDKLTNVKAKFRYRQKDIECNVEYLDNNCVKLTYDGVKAVTPGQFCVLYDNELCLGGGIIKETYK